MGNFVNFKYLRIFKNSNFKMIQYHGDHMINDMTNLIHLLVFDFEACVTMFDFEGCVTMFVIFVRIKIRIHCFNIVGGTKQYEKRVSALISVLSIIYGKIYQIDGLWKGDTLFFVWVCVVLTRRNFYTLSYRTMMQYFLSTYGAKNFDLDDGMHVGIS